MEKKNTVNLNLKQYGMVLALLAIYIIFYILTGGSNATPMNMNNLLMQNGYIVILATGMLLCVLTGNIDLGVGSYVALCGAVIRRIQWILYRLHERSAIRSDAGIHADRPRTYLYIPCVADGRAGSGCI